MANPNGRKGSDAERKVANVYLATGRFPFADRRVKTGARDRGDIHGVPRIVTEVKDWGRQCLPLWLREAEVERINDNAWAGVVWHKIRGKGDPLDWAVSMTGRQWIQIVTALDEAGVLHHD